MKINEIFHSIQGEGSYAGRPAVFVRLTGCNLRCNYCDAAYAFESGEEMSESSIISAVNKYSADWVCLTGGEPFLQDLNKLTGHLKLEGMKIQIETNGTIYQPIDCDWLVVSPKNEKQPDKLMLEKADEIKLAIDSEETLAQAKVFEKWGSRHFVQPVNNDKALTKLCVDFIKTNPNWNLSMQLHKLIGVK